jgi:hypothetical protein
MVDEFVCFTTPRFGMEKLEFNYTKNSDFVELLKNNSAKYQKPWFSQHQAKWNQHSNPPYVEMLTKHGIGFTFNQQDNLLNFEM